MKKRLLASLLSLCLLVGLLPTVALATGEGGTDGVQDSDTTPVTTTPTGDSGTEAEAVEPDTSWYTEAGTDATSYTISDVADLLGLAEITQNAAKAEETRTGDPADNFADKTVTLAADLNLENVPWFVQNDNETEPSVDHRIVEFAGTFGGGDHTISNLSFISSYSTGETGNEEPDRNDLGLFQSVTGTGTVENLTLDTVTASLSDYDQLAPLAHRFLGTAENCHVKNVTVTGTATEGAYIYAAGMVLFCEPEETGGTGESVSLTSCTVTGLEVKVEGAFDTGGGLVGQFGGSTALTVEDCSAKEIHFEADSLRWVFGLLGYADYTTSKDAKITVGNCLVSGVSFKAESITTAGGFSLTGSHKNEAAFTFTDCHVEDASFECGTGEMGWVGGFTSGTNIRNTFESCTVDGVVFRKESSDSPCYQVGGFSGNTQNTLTEADKDEACKFDNCHVTGLDMQVAGPATHESAYSGAYLSIGGFIGTASQGWAAIENCSVTGTIDSPSYAGEIGGFIGGLGWNANQTISVKDCEANVNVTAGGDAGGFIGRSADQSAEGQEDIAITLIVEDCIAKGSVTSLEGAAGGFVGAGDRGTYTDCTAEGTFVSGVKAGGFWGEIFPLKDSDSGFEVSITGCKASNSVQGSGHAAGFLGYADTAEDSKVTKVTIKSSAASPAVTGTTSTTEISCFLKMSNESSDTSNITLGSGEEVNTSSISIAKPVDSNGKIELDELNGDMEIKNANATATRCQLQAEDKSLSLPVGSIIHRDGSITIPADEDNPYGSTIDPEGTQRTHGVLTVSPDSSTVYSNAGTTSFTYTYNGNGNVTAESSDSSVATASVSGNTVTVTILKAGTASITVSAEETNEYTAAKDVHALTVLQYTSSGGSSSGTTTYHHHPCTDRLRHPRADCGAPDAVLRKYRQVSERHYDAKSS